MPSSSQQINRRESRTPSPEIVLSTRTSPSKLVKVSFRPFLDDWRVNFSSCDRDTQVARLFELDKNTAEAEVRELRRKLADITNQEEDNDNTEAPPSKRSRTSDVDRDELHDAEETRVIDAGHRFVMLYSPWLRNGEGTFKVECDSESEEAERFENAENKIQGQVREIKMVLGAQLSGEISSEAWIAKAVSQFFE